MTHRTDIEGFKSMAELAEAVGNLRYDALEVFLKALEAKMRKDSKADEGRGRKVLAYLLGKAGEELKDAASEIGEAWGICEPHMKKKWTLEPFYIQHEIPKRVNAKNFRLYDAFARGATQVWLNGQLQVRGKDYAEISSKTIRFYRRILKRDVVYVDYSPKRMEGKRRK